MITEHEYHLHRGAPTEIKSGSASTNGYEVGAGSSVYTIPHPDNDKSERIHNYDNNNLWTVEVYGNGRIIRFLEQVGAEEKLCLHDGRLFVVDAKQLVEALAEMNGLIIEFRKHRKRQYSEETKAMLRERLAKARASQKEVSSV